MYACPVKMSVNKFLHKCGLLVFLSSKKIFSYILNFWMKLLTKETNNVVRVLYHSDNFLVVEKPYDMVINSNNPDRKYTLQSELRKMLPNLVNPKLCHEFHFVHRLDYATSGVICIALNKRSAQIASNAFQNREAKKYYLALLHGHVEEPYIVIDEAIGSDIREKDGNRKMCTSNSIFCEKPRKSTTVLLVLEHGLRNNKPATKVLLCPRTGRRHQLRVHCDYIGHTIIGDYTYSARKDTEPHRTFLHSYRLTLDTELESLDIKTRDPFDTSDPKNQWKPTNIIRVLNEEAFSDIYNLVK